MLPVLGFSQQELTPAADKKVAIGFHPWYGIINGVRLDFDFRLPAKNQWLIVAPQFYMVTDNSSMWDINKMTGTGLDLQHRFYFSQTNEARGPWVAYGAVIQYRSVTDEGFVPATFREYGADYIRLENRDIRTSVWKTGGNLLAGYQLMAFSRFYFDFFLGTGIRFSFDNRHSGLHSQYNEWWGDMGYSGTLMTGGFRFGILL